MGSSSSTQAWLFAMTSGLASSLGAAAIYLDPVLHALGLPSDVNFLESHTALSAMLSGASGIMAYTSISVLTKESADYLSRIPEWPLLGKYPGAVTAVLFIVGAHLNLLLVRLVSRITPPDSPIKHACASHPPSPSGSELEEGSGHSSCGQRHHQAVERSSDTDGGPSAGYCSRQAHNRGSGGHLDRAGGHLNRAGGHLNRAGGSEGCSRHSSNERLPLLSQFPSHSVAGSASSAMHRSECRRCEYACAEPACYRLEHCHITPLYPHMHTHEHAGQSAQAHPSGSCCRGGSSEEAAERRKSRNGAGHDHSTHDTHEQAAHGGDPKADTAAQLSSRHHSLLMHVGLQTAVAIALHKVPEGLIIYLSRQASPRLGLSVAASLFAHNLPEGLMLALPLFLATRRRHMAFAVSSLMGAIPPAIGAVLGMLVVGDSSSHDRGTKLSGIFGVAFGLTAGMMCMVSLNGMLPTARIYDRSGSVVSWCFALGVAAMLFANAALK
ncbi:Zinc transporter [Coemansia sp. RSA 2050]|nr:Zinc transporter [Coemansia sp. RSA 2050]KAJ2728161.1 Zinc transporter [Coemansia sp. BCRC 34962]